MGGFAELKPGFWKATLYRTEYPDDHDEKVVRPHLTRAQALAESVHGCLVTMVTLALIGMIVSFFFLSWTSWLYWGVGSFLALLAAFIAFSYVPAYTQAAKIRDKIQLQFPSMIAVLEPVNNSV